MKNHDHLNSTLLGSGTLDIRGVKLDFINCSVYLEIKKFDEEQRICIIFPKPVNLKKIISKGDSFIDLQLNKPFSPPDKNISVKSMKIFVMSGVQDGLDQIDFLVSPKIDLFESMLHRHY